MKKYKNFDRKKAVLLISMLSLLQISCEFDTSAQYRYHPPEDIHDGLDVGSLEEIHGPCADAL